MWCKYKSNISHTQIKCNLFAYINIRQSYRGSSVFALVLVGWRRAHRALRGAQNERRASGERAESAEGGSRSVGGSGLCAPFWRFLRWLSGLLAAGGCAPSCVGSFAPPCAPSPLGARSGARLASACAVPPVPVAVRLRVFWA